MKNDIWATLPKELVNKILEYTGKIKRRNGVYINQLDMIEYESKIQLLPCIIKKNIYIMEETRNLYQWNYDVFVNFETIPYRFCKYIRGSTEENPVTHIRALRILSADLK